MLKKKIIISKYLPKISYLIIFQIFPFDRNVGVKKRDKLPEVQIPNKYLFNVVSFASSGPVWPFAVPGSKI